MAKVDGLARPISTSRLKSRLLVHWLAMKAPAEKSVGLEPVSWNSEMLAEFSAPRSALSRP
jgi:hypothetical protein